MVYISGVNYVLDDIMIEKKWMVKEIKQKIEWVMGVKCVGKVMTR